MQRETVMRHELNHFVKNVLPLIERVEHLRPELDMIFKTEGRITRAMKDGKHVYEFTLETKMAIMREIQRGRNIFLAELWEMAIYYGTM